MATPGFEAFAATTGRDLQNWQSLTNVSRDSWERRARGDRSFIPSQAPARPEYEEVKTPVAPMPPPETPAVELELTDQRIPRGAKVVINRLVKNGWAVRASWCRGPWPKQAEAVTDDQDQVVEKIKYGQADSLLINARRGRQKITVFYLFREWLKDAKFDRMFGYAKGPTLGRLTDSEVTALVTREMEDS